MELLWHTITPSWDTRCKDRLPWRFQSPRNDDPGPLSATERLWSKLLQSLSVAERGLTGIQTFESRLTSSQHIPTVRETPDSLLASWLQSCIQCIAYSLLHTASIAQLLGRHYSRVLRHYRKATWLDRQHSGGERNRPFTRPIFFRVAKLFLGTRLFVLHASKE